MGTFYCDPKKINNTVMYLSDTIKLRHTTDLVSITEQISKICRFFGDYLNEWNEHLEAKRVEFPVLNHFTIKQLVVLCEKMAVLFQPTGRVDNYVYLLLHPVHQHCTADILKDAFNKAFRKINQINAEMASKEPESEHFTAETTDDDDDDDDDGGDDDDDDDDDNDDDDDDADDSKRRSCHEMLQEGTCILFPSEC